MMDMQLPAEATIDDVVENGTNKSRRREEMNTTTTTNEQAIHSKKKRKAVGFFDESGLTDSQRRELRQEQRIIANNLRDSECCNDIEQIDIQRDHNNTLFQEKVCYTREAVLDADNVELIVGKVSKHIEKMVQVPRYDAMKLATKLAQKCSLKRNGYRAFDWRSFGRESGVCYNTVPDNVSFLAGYLDQPAEVKKKQARKQRVKEVIDESKEEEPEAITKNKSDADQLSAAEKDLKQLRKVLKDRARESISSNSNNKNKNEVDGVKFLFNPKSFTQTVENLFNFSFLIKRGEAEIGVNDDMGLYVRPRSAPSDDQQVENTQAVVSFTMRDWQRIVAQRNIENGDIPHRTGSKHTRVIQ